MVRYRFYFDPGECFFSSGTRRRDRLYQWHPERFEIPGGSSAHTHSDAYSDRNTYANADFYTYSYINSHANTYSNSNSYAHANPDYAG